VSGLEDGGDVDAALVGEGGMAGVGMVVVVLQVGHLGDEARQPVSSRRPLGGDGLVAHLQLQVGQMVTRSALPTRSP
jgi:hypothetical protein